ncbi:MAG: preprotein translocase subunit SecA [Erysipelothrix sp.]|nr:preprotein translocase subunit SecA [Erysipelothrix sp.]
MTNFLRNLFSNEKKQLNNLEKQAQQIDALGDQYAMMSDDELKNKTLEFKKRLSEGQTLDDILVEAYATAREAAKRIIGEYPYLVQLMGGIVLHQGDIAEMKTGEGKTLTSVLPAYLNGLSGKGVHVITVNEYLAERDANWMGKIHEFLGLTVAVNKRAMTPSEKKKAYEADILYSTNSEVGFDYLRDNMVTSSDNRVQRPLNFALIDEVDSILVDESRTPLIISGGKKQTAKLYQQTDKFVKKLNDGEDFEYDEKSNSTRLLEPGVEKAERTFKVNNLYDVDNTPLVHRINQALKANYTMANDVEYVVKDNAVVIVDSFTGRLMEGREFSDGLHQALEAKEGVTIKEETATMATITYQNFFRLYSKLSGMTGTAKTEEEEFLKIYNMRVIEIPTNRPIARIDHPDKIFGTKKAKFNALVNEIMRVHETGQPLLVGTASVEVSEFVSKMLTQRKIKHEVLNAKNHSREADIIKKAGQIGSVTIATNMAGRGTDIKLGEGVREMGGLAVLGSERHEARRIDNQLRGRSGRQGDPGWSQFYVSLKDDLMIRFGSERYAGLFDQFGDEAITNKTVTRAITSAQKRIEGQNFDVRKTLLDYDDVLRQQREIMYEQRNYVLDNEDVHSVVKDMFSRVINHVVDSYTIEDKKEAAIDFEGLKEALAKLGFDGVNLSQKELETLSVQDASTLIVDEAFESYDKKIKPYREQVLPIEKRMVLQTIDRAWMDHIDTMDKLRHGIHLRSYAQNNPLEAYVSEGYEMFEDMLYQIAQDIVAFCLNVQIRVEKK